MFSQFLITLVKYVIVFFQFSFFSFLQSSSFLHWISKHSLIFLFKKFIIHFFFQVVVISSFLLLQSFILFRVLVADGRTCVSVQTLMRQVNVLYQKLGFAQTITSKSAKVLGVTTAFFLGMTDDEVRILGRWKDISTSQYYRSIDHSTLLNIFSKLHLTPEKKHDSSHSVINFSSFSDRLVGLSSYCKSVIL